VALHFDAEPQAAHLAFHDGSRVDLHRDGADWVGERALAASSLYRIELDGAPPLGDDLHRIDVVVDRAPAIRIVVPDKTLSEYDGAQTTWPLEFEADDDYGIAKAELSVTHAQGATAKTSSSTNARSRSTATRSTARVASAIATRSISERCRSPRATKSSCDSSSPTIACRNRMSRAARA
jgi:hypothetical protein